MAGPTWGNTPPPLRQSDRPTRKLRGVPLTHDEQVLARATAAELETEKLCDIAFLRDTVECIAGGMPESAKPAFYAEFFTAVALRQGTIVNAVHTHCETSLNPR